MRGSINFGFFLVILSLFYSGIVLGEDVAKKDQVNFSLPHPVSSKVLDMTSPQSVIDALGARGYSEGIKVALDIPAVFYSNKSVPVRVRSEYQNTDLIVFVVDRAPRPLVFALNVKPQPEFDVVFSLDVNKTSQVRALVRADGKWYGVDRVLRLATETWK